MAKARQASMPFTQFIFSLKSESNLAVPVSKDLGNSLEFTNRTILKRQLVRAYIDWWHVRNSFQNKFKIDNLFSEITFNDYS